MYSNLIKMTSKKTKFIVITGGVLSGLGKGVACASIGSLLKKKHKIVVIKCDGYLNADPGTMNPKEHGEVFVLGDGGEVDMDFGHYERFLSIEAKKNWNITMGKIYQSILKKERKGDFLGKTVQLIPHVTDEIKNQFYQIAKKENADLALIEIGGTIGDMENNLFVEAVRQMKNELPEKSLMDIHLTYLPFYSGTKEFKTKPTQMSVRELNQHGIYPQMIICRSEKKVDEDIKKKLSLYCNVEEKAIIIGMDVKHIEEIPLLYQKQGVLEIIEKSISLQGSGLDQKEAELINILKKNDKKKQADLKIAICGKYTDLADSYASINEALKHCSAHLDVKIELQYIDTVMENSIAEQLKEIDGVIVPGGFGTRGIEGKIEFIQYIRHNQIPFLGICYGMQLAVIEFARNVCNIKNANTTEIIPNFTETAAEITEKKSLKVSPVVDILPSQKNIKEKGASMRLGKQETLIKVGTLAEQVFQSEKIAERFRHRYEVNPKYVEQLEKNGMIFSGKSSAENIAQVIELDKKFNHPFFLAAQFHPELTSKLVQPSKMFYSFIKAILKIK